MQVDMHYYGTYAMARAAGIKKDACEIIATAAQFVDDNASKESLDLKDSARIDVGATAHHPENISNIDEEDQRKVWVPFHFIPGNEGEGYTERLICRKDSKIAREMVANNISQTDAPYILELVGVTAHVYADTFSHYGFSGVSSRRNRVDTESFEFRDLTEEMRNYISGKADDFFKKYNERKLPNIRKNLGKDLAWYTRIKCWAAKTFSGALGHGSVATFPDRPYLKWSFDFEYPEKRRIDRDNPETFLEGCKALHSLFRDFLEKCPQYSDGSGKEFSSIEDRVNNIINNQDKCEGRIGSWQNAATGGDLFLQGAEQIAIYDDADWLSQREKLEELSDSRDVNQYSVYKFYQAASYHRNYVLRHLLPIHGLIVD